MGDAFARHQAIYLYILFAAPFFHPIHIHTRL